MPFLLVANCQHSATNQFILQGRQQVEVQFPFKKAEREAGAPGKPREEVLDKFDSVVSVLLRTTASAEAVVAC